MSGCTVAVPRPDLGGLYDQAAQYHDAHRNPVIVIPGILGSKLVQQDTRRIVWGAFGGGSANPQSPQGARLLALPMREGMSLRDLRDDVIPAGVLDKLRVSVLGLPIELKAYLEILGTLGVGGYRDELLGRSGAVDYGDDHYTCFQFDYDWRRDLVENAQRLHEFILKKRSFVQDQIQKRFGLSDHPVKFDIVAHSMGGLVARYYLRYGPADLPADGPLPPPTWAGATNVDHVILLGTPNAGSVKAFVELVDGVQFAPILPKHEAALLGTMPAVYQLLPRTRHAAVVGKGSHQPLNLFDVDLWQRMKWGLADPKQDRVLKMLMPDIHDRDTRRRIAMDHLAKCLRRADRFFQALDTPSTPPAGTSLYLIAGDAVPTSAVAAVESDTGRITIIEQRAGDGTVPRDSALLDERVGQTWQPKLVSPIAWRGVHFLFSSHLGMIKDPAFADNVLYILLESPR